MRPWLSAALGLLALLAPRPARAQGDVDERAFFLAEEAFLRDFDINDPLTRLSLMADLEGSSMMLKVKDASGRTVGVFKPTSGNTSHVSEIVAYRLCRRLMLPVCAPTVRKALGPGAIARFIALLEEKEFKAPEHTPHAAHYEAKERFRRAMIDRLRGTEFLEGAFKSWISPLILYEGLGTVEAVKTHAIYPYLSHDGPVARDETFTISQCTRIYKPAGCYTAEIKMRDLLEQFTGMMIVDALTGDADRFAGGNVHAFSLEARYEELGPGRYRLPRPSLLMLDNGAGFMQSPARVFDLITKELGITRFSPGQHAALSKLWDDFREDRESVMIDLGMVEEFEHAGKNFSPTKVFALNLPRLIRYLEIQAARR